MVCEPEGRVGVSPESSKTMTSVLGGGVRDVLDGRSRRGGGRPRRVASRAVTLRPSWTGTPGRNPTRHPEASGLDPAAGADACRATVRAMGRGDREGVLRRRRTRCVGGGAVAPRGPDHAPRPGGARAVDVPGPVTVPASRARSGCWRIASPGSAPEARALASARMLPRGVRGGEGEAGGTDGARRAAGPARGAPPAGPAGGDRGGGPRGRRHRGRPGERARRGRRRPIRPTRPPRSSGPGPRPIPAPRAGSSSTGWGPPTHPARPIWTARSGRCGGGRRSGGGVPARGCPAPAPPPPPDAAARRPQPSRTRPARPPRDQSPARWCAGRDDRRSANWVARHRLPCASRRSRTIRPHTSGATGFTVLPLSVTSAPQRLGPPANPARLDGLDVMVDSASGIARGARASPARVAGEPIAA